MELQAVREEENEQAQVDYEEVEEQVEELEREKEELEEEKRDWEEQEEQFESRIRELETEDEESTERIEELEQEVEDLEQEKEECEQEKEELEGERDTLVDENRELEQKTFRLEREVRLWRDRYRQPFAEKVEFQRQYGVSMRGLSCFRFLGFRWLTRRTRLIGSPSFAHGADFQHSSVCRRLRPIRNAGRLVSDIQTDGAGMCSFPLRMHFMDYRLAEYPFG